MKDYVKEILIQAREGDENAFTELYELYQSSVFLKANQIVCNEADAQDVVQETFLIVHRKLNQLRDIDLFYSWLMSITISRCHMQFRKNKHYSKYDDQEMVMQQKEERNYLDPYKNTQNKNEHDILMKLIDSLSPKKAQIIRLFYLEEMKLNEISSYLGISVNTVKTRLKRARQDLHDLIVAYEEREQVTLQFDNNALLPAGFLSGGFLLAFYYSMKRKIKKITTYFKGHPDIAGCCLSLLALTTYGCISLYQETENNQRELLQPSKVQESQYSDALSLQVNAPYADYKPVFYQNELIKTAREAYYICINFAMDENDMKQKSAQEMKEILPVYESLKQSQSPYYESLVKDHWSDLFERYAK